MSAPGMIRGEGTSSCLNAPGVATALHHASWGGLALFHISG